MPASERGVLFQQTMQTLRGTCVNATGPTVKEYCRNQAEFVGLFPECDDPCRALVLRFTSSPTR